jgi:hypothetical protein
VVAYQLINPLLSNGSTSRSLVQRAPERCAKNNAAIEIITTQTPEHREVPQGSPLHSYIGDAMQVKNSVKLPAVVM